MGENEDKLSANKRWSFIERQEAGIIDWILSEKLFGPGMIDIHDFEPHHYTCFLDHVSSLDELITGLQQLSPSADDALSIAEKMSEREFQQFKNVTKTERRMNFVSNAPKKFRTLLLPNNILKATILAEKYEVCLGTALVRLMEPEPSESLPS